MAWWPLRRASSPQVEETEVRGTYASPAFGVLSAALRTVPAPRILDLGAAVAANLDLFVAYGGHLRVVDLLNEPGPLAEQLPDDETAFDAVLAWNLFDHLPPPSLPDLATELARRTRPGGCLFILLGRRADRPIVPTSFRVVDAHTLSYTVSRGPQRSGPRHTPAALERLLEGFGVESTFLLRHGVQEYLFRREARRL